MHPDRRRSQSNGVNVSKRSPCWSRLSWGNNPPFLEESFDLRSFEGVPPSRFPSASGNRIPTASHCITSRMFAEIARNTSRSSRFDVIRFVRFRTNSEPVVFDVVAPLVQLPAAYRACRRAEVIEVGASVLISFSENPARIQTLLYPANGRPKSLDDTSRRKWHSCLRRTATGCAAWLPVSGSN